MAKWLTGVPNLPAVLHGQVELAPPLHSHDQICRQTAGPRLLLRTMNMRIITLCACSALTLATTAAATSPPAVDTIETIRRHLELSQFRALLGEQSFAPTARISLIAPIDESCDVNVMREITLGKEANRKAFIENHALKGFIYTDGYDLQPNGRPVSVTWSTIDRKSHRIGEGEHLSVETVAGGSITVEVQGGQIFVGHHLVPRGGVDVAMNGSVIQIHGCDRLG